MAYQFVHIQTYSLKPTLVQRTKDHYNDLNQVFGEALRDQRYSRHIATPRPPQILTGFGLIAPAELRRLHDAHRTEIRETVRKKGGGSYERGLKTDAPTLYTEIHSHPITSAEYLGGSEEIIAEIETWADRLLRDFRARMPEDLSASAVMHLDEKYVHIHVLAVNLTDPKLSANKLHVGKVAAAALRTAHGPAEALTSLPRPEPLSRPLKPKRPKPSKNRVTQARRMSLYEEQIAAWQERCAEIERQNSEALATWTFENDRHMHKARKNKTEKNSEKAAYEAAMASFQDDYYEAVGKPCGLLRHGPRNARLSTVQYAERKAHARHIAKVEAAQRELDLSNKTKAERLEKEEKALGKQVDTLKERLQRIETENEKLVRRKQKVDAQEDEIAERENAAELREQVATRKLQESEAGLKTMRDMLDMVEDGRFLEMNEPDQFLHRAPKFLQQIAATEPDERSTVQKMVIRFAGLLQRVVTAMGGGPEKVPPEINRGPEL
ncbi:Mob protein [Thioclava sp. NG1]|uniref:Mob protein n=1 Tax=Thioclava sp. NG1 TaxID=2182426 RepID=UPI000D6071EE|nr:Mob protein [Thioclava sp. NG1]PWE48168.1 Mob protein [Thioclava sp. NG1]